MGPHLTLLWNGHHVGHFYPDAEDGIDVDAVLTQLAAAPKLLEALQSLVNCNLDHPGGSCDHYERATSAIARATGAPTP